MEQPKEQTSPVVKAIIWAGVPVGLVLWGLVFWVYTR